MEPTPPNQTRPPDPRDLLRAGLRDSHSSDPGPTAPLAPGPPEDADTVASYFPQFEFLGELGRGGMGVVYKVRQPSLDRFAALKVVTGHLRTDAPAFRERFVREARALARLGHQNIVTVYDFGDANGRPFLLMEYVEGTTLRATLDQGAMAPEVVLEIMPHLCDALDYAHGEGVIHRDIKPENILIDQRGRVKIADFGLAKLVELEPRSTRITLSGAVMGTLSYMAPEQIERPAEVDHRADIFAIGVVLYEMLTGELPTGRFDLPSIRVGCDPRLDSVVLRALERDPVRRYQQVRGLRTDLLSIARGANEDSALIDTGPLPPPTPSKMAVASTIAHAVSFVAMLPWLLGTGRLMDLLGGTLPSELLAAAALQVAGIILGFFAAWEILNSRGRLQGMGAAVAGILLPPCLLTGALIGVALGGASGAKLAEGASPGALWQALGLLLSAAYFGGIWQQLTARLRDKDKRARASATTPVVLAGALALLPLFLAGGAAQRVAGKAGGTSPSRADRTGDPVTGTPTQTPPIATPAPKATPSSQPPLYRNARYSLRASAEATSEGELPPISSGDIAAGPVRVTTVEHVDARGTLVGELLFIGRRTPAFSGSVVDVYVLRERFEDGRNPPVVSEVEFEYDGVTTSRLSPRGVSATLQPASQQPLVTPTPVSTPDTAASPTPTPTPAPVRTDSDLDLEAVRLTLQGDPVDRTARLTVTFRQRGSDNGSGFFIWFVESANSDTTTLAQSQSQRFFDEARYPRITSESMYSTSVPFGPDRDGEFTLTVVLDPYRQLGEQVMTNNVASIHVIIRDGIVVHSETAPTPPDVLPNIDEEAEPSVTPHLDLAATRLELVWDESMRRYAIEATCSNEGMQPISRFFVRFLCKGERMEQSRRGGNPDMVPYRGYLQADSVAAFAFRDLKLEDGETSFTVVVNPDRSVVDSVPSNDCLSIGVRVLDGKVTEQWEIPTPPELYPEPSTE